MLIFQIFSLRIMRNTHHQAQLPDASNMYLTVNSTDVCLIVHSAVSNCLSMHILYKLLLVRCTDCRWKWDCLQCCGKNNACCKESTSTVFWHLESGIDNQIKCYSTCKWHTNTICEIQPNTGGTVHELASRWTATESGRTRTMFAGRPPPVMCAAAFTNPDLNTARVLLT